MEPPSTKAPAAELCNAVVVHFAVRVALFLAIRMNWGKPTSPGLIV